jgi:SAM-dependent methyltransferase
MSEKYYTKTFFEQLRMGATRSAQAIVPLVLQLVRVDSVVDVGCGDGSWLAVFREFGVEKIFGIDGKYVDLELLQIPTDSFYALDLTKPFRLQRTFDLAVSLEVAEHLPSESAANFVESLTRLAPLVLFSAAIPFQSGTHHINEQWPDYWASLFQRHGYAPVDFIRERIWQNENVESWYSQNILLYAEGNFLEQNPNLKIESGRTNLGQLCVVHPKQYLYLNEKYKAATGQGPPSGVRVASRLLLICLRNALRKRVSLLLGKNPGADRRT